MDPIFSELKGLVEYMQNQCLEDVEKRAKETTVLLPFDVPVRVEVRISGAARNSWVMEFFTAKRPLKDTVSRWLADERYCTPTVDSYPKLTLVLNEFYKTFSDAEKERTRNWVQASPPHVVRLASAGPLPQTDDDSLLSSEGLDSEPSVPSDDLVEDPTYRPHCPRM